MDFFWPSDFTNPPTDKYLQTFVARNNIKKDAGAICYAFYTLQWLSSREIIAQRKVAIGEITSRMLGILPSEEDTEFIENATRTVYKQLYWARCGLENPEYREVLGEAFIPTIKGMWDAVKKRHNYYLRDY